MAYYRDIREQLETLEEKGLLTRITREINKDTELQALVALQYRGLCEEQRKAFLFENVTDSRGRKYGTPVALSALAGTRDIYAVGLKCQPDELAAKWDYAISHPIKPVMVESGAVYEEIHTGNGLLKHGGLDEFPIPNATPGFDPAPFFSAHCVVSKDPETGIRNVGTYRSHVKSPSRTSMFLHHQEQHLGISWSKCRKLGIPLQAAIFIGGPPCITYTSVSKLGYDDDEFDVAGGLAGEPILLTRCKTVDLEVPAFAEIVIEGEISVKETEPEGPFGEFQGYMGPRENCMPFFDVKCIAHRKNPVLLAIGSRFPPSENTKIVEIAREAAIYKVLNDINIQGIKAVAVLESAGACAYVVIQMEKPQRGEVMRALETASHTLTLNKVCVAVDTDIDPWDAVAVNWAISYRSDPQRDAKIIYYPAPGTDFSIEPIPDTMARDASFKGAPQASRLLIDATLKWPYPPLSLPKKEFMERAIEIWEQENLPKLNLQEPWWGYSLGYWTDEEDTQAKLAVEGRYYESGETLAKRRSKLEE
ncbi:UbiD family decarboxylase [Chloroflexota bacterium]